MFCSRRQWLSSATCGFGSLALMDLLNQTTAAEPIASNRGGSAPGPAVHSPLAPKQPHHRASADRLIFLHMRGGPSAMESYERKPELDRRAEEQGEKKGRKLTPSHWAWKKRGDSGLWVSDLFRHTAELADELCVLSGMHTDIGNHTPAMLQLHTGSFTFTRPSMGSWLLYGLGTENQNLPGFVSISPPVINGGSKNYGSAFLPAVFQGTAIGDIKTPVRNAKVGNLDNPILSSPAQRTQLDFLKQLNADYAAQIGPDDSSDVDAVIDSFELGFRMQSELPDVMDLSGETQETLDLYGIGDGKPSDDFGRQCLLARRMVEAGVRHVELCDEFWDQHNQLVKGHEARAAATDQPIAGLLTDLRRRGLLDRTLVLWGGEFGRTPDTAKKDLDGRDHNPNGYTMWMAGGGVRGGFQHGATDELGYRAVEGRVHLHDLHATVLHLMGLDHQQLTYRYAGRDFRLTDVHGHVVSEIIA
ncbi:DUF1501 domain-containing protein [Roseiconus nitratireducens]|uniref:DUF1501 domain-containing protein n=1 Tax=Roseiconus nitratireducens TaxID=2605748 RepID=A0A5M6D475_9BACT|nr:DUF1501 domain-containing protein [Roseiconus nitratireducens]KAA5542281.1 DUF1501 domain-containing protein [Roseiconus nitratireducens]